jgi:hypothetical protein
MKKLRVISRASFRRNSDTQFVTPIMEVAIVPRLPSHTVSLGHETVIPVTPNYQVDYHAA